MRIPAAVSAPHVGPAEVGEVERRLIMDITPEFLKSLEARANEAVENSKRDWSQPQTINIGASTFAGKIQPFICVDAETVFAMVKKFQTLIDEVRGRERDAIADHDTLEQLAQENERMRKALENECEMLQAVECMAADSKDYETISGELLSMRRRFRALAGQKMPCNCGVGGECGCPGWVEFRQALAGERGKADGAQSKSG